MKQFLFLLAVALQYNDNIMAQSWERTYLPGGANQIQQTNDGGYILVGNTYGINSTIADVLVIRLNAIGDTLWTKTYGGINEDFGNSIEKTADGGFIIAGTTESFGAGKYDVYLIRVNVNGDILWTKTYGGISYDWGSSVKETNDGGFIITGFSMNDSLNNRNMYLIKTDNLGDSLWTKLLSNVFYSVGHSVTQSLDGGFIIAGTTTEGGLGGNIQLVKTDADGSLTWSKIYGAGLNDEGKFVQQTDDGGYIISGYKQYAIAFNQGENTLYILKTDANGDTLWTLNRYDGNFPSGETGNSIIQTNNGHYVVASGGTGFLLTKIDANGQILWTKAFGEGASAEATSVEQTSDGGFVIAGSKNGEVYVVKTNNLGELPISDIKEEDQHINSVSLYPNPTNGDLRLLLEDRTLEAKNDIALIIVDLLGREVLSINNVKANTELSLSNESNGIYFYKVLNRGEFISSGKLVVRK